MSDALIRATLEAALFAVAGFPDASHRALENEEFDPPADELWARITHFWGAETLGSLPAAGGTLWRYGIVNLGLFSPLLAGPAASDTLAQAIRTAFPARRTFSIGGRRLEVTDSRRWNGRRDPGGPLWHVPVDISWKMRALNP